MIMLTIDGVNKIFIALLVCDLQGETENAYFSTTLIISLRLMIPIRNINQFNIFFRYRNAVRRLKQLALDAPMTGLEKAVWWTEYVIRNKGAKHLRNPAADIPFYQYYLIDVISFLLGVTALVIAAVVVAVKFLYRFISTKFLTKQAAVHKKIN